LQTAVNILQLLFVFFQLKEIFWSPWIFSSLKVLPSSYMLFYHFKLTKETLIGMHELF
jgi:hypothetical protein